MSRRTLTARLAPDGVRSRTRAPRADTREVRKVLATLAVTAALAVGGGACGGGSTGSGQEPGGTSVESVPTNNPVERSRDAVDQLNEQQRQLEDQTGG
jgi:hypothetical protein